MWFVATQNFAVAGALQDAPAEGFVAVTSGLDTDSIRLATRHQAGEVNRLFFYGWGLVQIPIALLAFGLAWSVRSSRILLVIMGLMLLIVLVLQLYVVPETIRLGRVLDFVPRDPASPGGSSFLALAQHLHRPRHAEVRVGAVRGQPTGQGVARLVSSLAVHLAVVPFT